LCIERYHHLLRTCLEVELSFDLNARGGYYGTALQAAAYYNFKDIVQLLLEHEAEINDRAGLYGTALQAAVVGRDLGMIALLLKHGADPNIQCGDFGTALQAAAAFGATGIVALLLKHGANPNLRYPDDETVLQVATVWGDVHIRTLLLKHGADPHVRRGNRSSTLRAEVNNTNTAMLLLEHEAILVDESEINRPTKRRKADLGMEKAGDDPGEVLCQKRNPYCAFLGNCCQRSS
jgi:ankyrin repeat protein